MPSILNMCSILENYCYSRKISEIELDFLEKCWLDSLNLNHYNKFPSFAPSDVCDVASIDRGSYWIVCNASILDKLRPLNNLETRTERVLEVLVDSGINYAA